MARYYITWAGYILNNINLLKRKILSKCCEKRGSLVQWLLKIGCELLKKRTCVEQEKKGWEWWERGDKSCQSGQSSPSAILATVHKHLKEGGRVWCKKYERKKFQGPTFGPKIFLRAPLFPPRKIGVNPTENHISIINSIFMGKISMICFSPPPFRISKF